MPFLLPSLGLKPVRLCIGFQHKNVANTLLQKIKRTLIITLMKYFLIARERVMLQIGVAL